MSGLSVRQNPAQNVFPRRCVFRHPIPFSALFPDVAAKIEKPAFDVALEPLHMPRSPPQIKAVPPPLGYLSGGHGDGFVLPSRWYEALCMVCHEIRCLRRHPTLLKPATGAGGYGP